MQSGTKSSYTKQVARMGVFVALAMIFSYVEALFPVPIPVPGVKLGLANLVVVIGLYLFPAKEVMLIALVRVLGMGLLFGNGATLFYSLAGAAFSLLMMLIAKRLIIFSVMGVSILGATFHNVGQILVAFILLGSREVFYYLPILLIAGVITGLVIGLMANQMIKILKKVDIPA